jgi:metal-sulfur cluster biosynthetic enzyme
MTIQPTSKALTSDLVYDRLKTLLDPELGVNLVDLGLIYAVEIQPNRRVKIRMTLTSPGCPLASVFEPMVKDALLDLVADVDEDIQVELTFDPPWTPDMMTEAVRLELGL